MPVVTILLFVIPSSFLAQKPAITAAFPAPESRHALYGLHFRFPIHGFQPFFQTVRRFIGRCKAPFECIYFFNKPIGALIFIFYIKAAAEYPAWSQNTENLAVRSLLIRKGMKAVQVRSALTCCWLHTVAKSTDSTPS